VVLYIYRTQSKGQNTMTKEVIVNGKTYTQQDIQDMLKTNDKAVIRAMLVIYEYQTEDEKNSDETLHANGMGFSGADAFILTQFTKFYKEHGFLSGKQLEIARKKMPKYAKQIFKHMQINASK